MRPLPPLPGRVYHSAEIKSSVQKLDGSVRVGDPPDCARMNETKRQRLTHSSKVLGLFNF